MPAQNLIDIGFDVQKATKEQEQILNLFKNVYAEAKKIDGLKINFTDFAGPMKEFKDASQQLSQVQEKLTKDSIAYEKTLQQLAKTKEANAKATQAEVKAETEIVKLIQQEAKAENELLKTEQAKQKAQALSKKQVDDLSNDYLQLSKAYNEAALKAKNYALRLGEQHPITLQAIKDAKGMYDILYRLDTSVGQHTRNVGNYSSAFNGLNQSFAQIGRELPSLTISAQQFFLAISNNLPMFADEIARAKTEIAALKAEGQQTPSLFSRITSAMFSWQTALSVGITLLVSYGKELGEWITSMFKGADATKAAAEQLQNYAKEADAAKVSLKNFNDELKAQQQLFNTNNRIRFFGDDAQNSLTEAKNNVAFLVAEYNKLNAAVDEATQRTLKAGEAFSVIVGQYGNSSEEAKKAEEDYNKVVNAQFELQEQQAAKLNELNLARRNVIIAEKEFEEDKNKEAADKKKKIDDQYFEYLKQKYEDEAEAFQEYVDEGGILFKERVKAAEDEVAKLKQLSNLILNHDLANGKLRVLAEYENTKRIQAAYEQLQKNIISIYADSKKDLFVLPEITAPVDNTAAELAKQKAAHDKFQKEILKNIQDFENDRQNIISQARDTDIKNLEENYAAGEISRERFEKKLFGIQTKYLKESLEAEIDALEKRLTLLEPYSAEWNKVSAAIASARKELAGVDVKTKDKELQDFLSTMEMIANAARLLSEAISTIGNISFERQKVQLEELAAQEEKNYQQETRNIELSTASMEEKAQRQILLDAKHQAQQEEYARRQREIDNKKAQFDKAAGIMNIIIGTAAAVAKASTVFEKIAFAALGAAQLAAAIATPVPQYFRGTSSAKEGWALTDEKGAELYIEPSGKTYLGNDEPTYRYLKAGTKIIPHDEVNQVLYNAMIRDTGKSLQQAKEKKKDVIDYDKMKQAFSSVMKQQKKPYVKVINNLGNDISNLNYIRKNLL